MGNVLLRRGDIEGARAHALTALRENAGHEDALHLLVSIKTRVSPLMGAWWHFNTRLSELGGQREALTMIGAYVVVQLLALILRDTGFLLASQVVRYLWLGMCVYTWVAPGVFRKMLQEELRQVRLRDDY
jgi:hypothetical protein